MKTQKTPRKRLALDGLVVDSFSPLPEIDAPQLGAATIVTCTRCPSHPDSLCPCCTGPELCG